MAYSLLPVGAQTLAVKTSRSAPTPTDASAKMTQPLTVKISWAGNTYGGTPYTTSGGWTDNKHVQLNAADLCVDADGTLYTDSNWDEGGYEAGIYKHGDEIGRCMELSHGWGRQGGYAVTVDAEYIYVDMTQHGDDGGDNGVRKNRNGLPVFPPRGTQWYCLRRFHKNGTSAPFPAGYGEWGDMMILNQATATNNSYPDASARGLAVYKGLLYVSDPYRNRIAVYMADRMDGSPIKTWTVASPWKIAFDRTGKLWLLQRGPNPKVLRYDAEGNLLPQHVTFASTVVPTALAWNSVKDRLMVADKGPDQNIKLYDPNHLTGAPTTPTSTFGVTGGIHSGIDGKVGPLRLYDPIGVGADSNGNLYVVNSVPGGPGISLEGYSDTGHQNWALRCLEFVTCADADPQTETEVYSTNKRYVLDYNQPNGSNWSFRGLTVNPFKYPDDPRLHRDFSGGCWVRRINGVTYLFITQQMGNEICVLRFDRTVAGSKGSETGIPYAYLTGGYHAPAPNRWPAHQPGNADNDTDWSATPRSGQQLHEMVNVSTEWIWRDANGNGKIDAGEYAVPAKGAPTSYNAGWGVWVDRKGDIWQCGHSHIRHFTMHLDGNGRPAWDYLPGHVELLDPPALPNGAHWQHGANPDNDDMDRLEYDPTTDTMYVSGFTSDYPDDSGAWGYPGRVLYRYDHWSGARKIHAGYPLMLPWGDKGSLVTKSISIEGGYLFAVQTKDPETVTVYDLNTARSVGTLSPGPEVGNRSGWVDANYGLRARRRSTGEYLIFVEEDLYEKALIYRWTPPH
jgi:hypothetical protein